MISVLLTLLLACGEKTGTTTAEPTTEQPAENINISDVEHFGADFTIETSVPAGTVLQDPGAYVDQRVRITGTVSDVCQKMGCWMVITDADKHMRITTKDHKFFVAKDGAGSTCDLEGVVVKRELDQARVDHFKSEQSEGAPLPEAEVQNNVVYEIVAEAVDFTRPTAEAAPAPIEDNATPVEESTEENAQ